MIDGRAEDGLTPGGMSRGGRKRMRVRGEERGPEEEKSWKGRKSDRRSAEAGKIGELWTNGTIGNKTANSLDISTNLDPKGTGLGPIGSIV